MNNLISYNHYISVNKRWKLTPQEIVRLQAEGITQKIIAKTHNRTDRTIRYWKKWTGEKLQKRGRKLRIVDDVLEKLISYVENNNTVTLVEISDCLFQATGQRFSVPTIFRALERVNKPLKKGTKQHIKQDKEKVKKFVAENSYLLSSDSLLALDECGFNLGAVPKYARADKGQRAVIKRIITKGLHYTLLLCIKNVNQQAVIHYQLTKEKIDAKFFYDFLEAINLPNEEKHYLLLDNATIHHAPIKEKH
ncbi:MAG: Transcriptional regulatory protein RcsB [Mycoplasmataceae bacterium]|nr:MAG: Transcriptional regulatory protein RcsB [Mycoplasmataceae bacterium]